MTQERLDDDMFVTDEMKTDGQESTEITKLKEHAYSMIAEVDTNLQEVVESFVEASSKAEEGNQVIHKGIHKGCKPGCRIGRITYYSSGRDF